MKTIIGSFLRFLGGVFSFANIHCIHKGIRWTIMQIYTGYKKRCFKFFGKSTIYPFSSRIEGGRYIKIGNNTEISKGITITAFDRHNNQIFTPIIEIGDNTSIGENAHITACGQIKIGNGVLTGKNILITDNSHGYLKTREEMEIMPLWRDLFVKGPIVIEDNVWIGSGAVILPNVHIGKGAVIAANSVVTKDVPSFSIAAGAPAVIVKHI